MALFKKPQKEEAFDFNSLLAQTKEALAQGYPSWHIFEVSNLDKFLCDLFIVSTKEIMEEVRPSTNPFSDYKKITPRIYQTVLTVSLCPEGSDKRAELPWETIHINAHSVRQITRAIEALERP